MTLCAEDVSTASPGIQLTAAHVVREGLDNALRHAGPTRVLVEVRRGAGDLVVTVTDAGPVADWSPSPGAGHGLTLLAERVRSHGGVLRAEPHGPGHRVRAVLPMDAG